MTIKEHKKKSGRKVWTVVKPNWLKKDDIVYMDQSKKACEHYIKRHEHINR